MVKADDATKQYSLDTLQTEHARGNTRTRADAPAHAVDEDFWRKARVVMPPPAKSSVHVCLDPDVPD